MSGGSLTMPNYQSYETSGESGDYDDEPSPELIVTPYSTFNGVLGAVFGTDSQFGQSLGLAFEDVVIEDGCLYVDPEKEKFKLFSWQKANDMSPQERFERGETPSVDDASDFIRKTYAGNEKEYELVAARMEPVEDEDGNVVVEAESKTRQTTFTDDGVEFSEYEYLGGDTVPFGNVVMWYNGTTENGPSVASKSLAETLTQFGENAVADEDDLYNWLRDATSNNVVRDDLQGERVRFFTVTRDGEEYTYNMPIVEDMRTDARVMPQNRQEEGGDGPAGEVADQSDSGDVPAEESYPEPIADFIESGKRLELDDERANKLLNDLIEDESNGLTEAMISDNGGRDEILSKVL